MASIELLEQLEIQDTNTVGELYDSVAEFVNTRIDSITEAMRGNVLRVRSIRRGRFMDLQRTKVRVGGIRHIPSTQDLLMTRWADTTNGHIGCTNEVIAGKSWLHRPYGGEVDAKATNERGYAAKASFEPHTTLQELESRRQDLLFAAAHTVVAHATAIEQINNGTDPYAVLAALRNPELIGLPSANS